MFWIALAIVVSGFLIASAIKSGQKENQKETLKTKIKEFTSKDGSTQNMIDICSGIQDGLNDEQIAEKYNLDKDIVSFMKKVILDFEKNEEANK